MREWQEHVARNRLNRALEAVEASRFDKEVWTRLDGETQAAFALEDMDRLADACEKFVEDVNARAKDSHRNRQGVREADRGQGQGGQNHGRAALAQGGQGKANVWQTLLATRQA
jgi:hypothetical protein